MATLVKTVYAVKCVDFGMDCPFELQAETEGEILRYNLEHALSVHGMSLVDKDIRPQIKQRSWSR